MLLTVDGKGRWASVTPGVAAPTEGATLLRAPVLPGLVNAHSHAFQRAFARLAERRQGAQDNFWSWRERMYAVAQRVSPAHLQAIAAQLYAELLEGGYTQVCEFHYLHHAPDGQPYADPYAMTWALTRAASLAGLGLTVLPTLYERAGFAVPALRSDQQRFATDAAWVAKLVKAVIAEDNSLVTAGAAIHSLRAASPASIHRLVGLLADTDCPLHIHVAEQQAEVTDCLASTGQRPVQWLSAQGLLDPRWHLVHATHSTAQEIDAVAAAGAQVVICPSTEANLGDGLTDMAHWLNASVGMAIGSDSHVCRIGARSCVGSNMASACSCSSATCAPRLRWECSPPRSACSTRRWRAGGALRGSASRAYRWRASRYGGLNAQCPALLGVPVDYTLDAVVFAADSSAVDAVYVAGKQVVRAASILLKMRLRRPMRDHAGDLGCSVVASHWLSANLLAQRSHGFKHVSKQTADSQ